MGSLTTLMMKLTRCVQIALVGIGLSPTAFASLIRIDFQGTVLRSDFSSVSVGNVFTGSAFYSSPDVPLNFDPSACSVVFAPVVCVAAGYLVPLPFFVSVNGSTITTANLSPPWTGISVTDTISGGKDGVNMEFGLPLLSGPLAAEAGVADTADLNFQGPLSLLSSPQIPSVFPTLGKWIAADFLYVSTNGELQSQVISGPLTSLTSTEVPEPWTFPALLFVLCLAILAPQSRKRVCCSIRPQGPGGDSCTTLPLCVSAPNASPVSERHN